MKVTRAFDILTDQLEQYPQPDCLAAKIGGKWVPLSTRQVVDTVNNLSLGLLRIGVAKDHKVAIISMNRPEWVMADYAIQQLGAVSVPMYPTMTEKDYTYIFNDAQVKVIFVADKSLYQKVKAATKGIEGIEAIYTFDAVDGATHYSELIQAGEKDDPRKLNEYKAAVDPQDLLTLIYTSGTTGNPKGVMLTHHNLVSNYKSCRPYVPVNHEHRALSFLPLSHIYERMLTYLYMSVGVSIYYAEGLETIGENLKEVKPHVFTTVPRLLEKVYDKIVAKGSELTGVKKKLFFWALDLGHQFDVRGRSWWYTQQLALARKLIFSKWQEALGGNVIAIVSGWAPLQPRLARVFWAADIRVMEGYGLTETSPVISVNRHDPKDHMIGTVGPLVDNVEAKIAEDGEIVTRGPSVMKGYYKLPDLTAEVIDPDGWFHTGDIGEFVEGRYLKITDRKKEMFKTSGGKYVSPSVIENKLKESTLIEQVMVVGAGEKFPGALIVPAFPALQEWCKDNNIPYSTDAEVIRHPEVISRYKKEIEHYNENFGQWERVKKFELLPNMWSIETGELTPKMSMKRKIIVENHSSLIRSMYQLMEK
ncbi:long-chain fatty acid--CoA ligase [soil metagenome]